jgi:glutamyl-tRNA synthetase
VDRVSAELDRAGVPEEVRAPFWRAIRENVATRAEIADWWRLCVEGAAPLVAEEDRGFVAEALALLPEPPYGPESWSAWTAAVKEATGRKGRALFMPLRKAVTGREKGPEMAELMPLLRVRPKL